VPRNSYLLGVALFLYGEVESFGPSPLIGRALWVTSWPFAQYVNHRWGGAWVCSCFRAGRASVLIRDALAATRHTYGEPPTLGMVTFIDRRHVRPIKVRGEDTWGRTWLLEG